MGQKQIQQSSSHKSSGLSGLVNTRDAEASHRWKWREAIVLQRVFLVWGKFSGEVGPVPHLSSSVFNLKKSESHQSVFLSLLLRQKFWDSASWMES